nr:immunoglobulin heavy chain junction region [Mus musculus]
CTESYYDYPYAMDYW